MRFAMALLALALGAPWVLEAASKPLEIFFVDVEGGQATLFVSPAGKSLLVDTGWGYNAYRDANRIVAAAKLARIKQIDYVLITHYHTDHVGGVPQLASKLHVGTYLDHGPNREDTNATKHLVEEYQTAIGSSAHRALAPGDHVDLKDADIEIVSADGNVLTSPIAGAGQANGACGTVARKEPDPTENARSLGFILRFGRFVAVDMGDLTWNKELDLMCPANRLGKADLLIASHHGSDLSGSPALVHALAPRVAVVDNGAKKGGSPSAWDILKSSPGIEDIWQLHFADAGGAEHNTSDPFIANVLEADTGFYLKLTANEDGTFTLYNPRNKFAKTYAAK